MWQRLGDHSPYDDLDITNDRIKRWHPLNQSLYVGYKVMLAGLLMISKGDRIAMNASVETRYPFLDDDVIAFCAGIAPEYKLRGHDREMDLAPGGGANPARADRQPAQDDVSRVHVGDLSRPATARLGGPVAEPRVAPGHGLFRPGGRGAPAGLADANPADHARAGRVRRGPDLRRLDPALASHLLRRRPLRPARLASPRRKDLKEEPFVALPG